MTEENLDGRSIEVSIEGTTFKDDLLDKNNFTLNNEPEGLTIESVTYIDSTHVIINLAFNGTDFDSDITNFGLKIAQEELNSGSDIILSNTLNITAFLEVTFNVDGGSYVPIQRIENNGKVVEPQAPSKGDYSFAGWYTDNSFTTPFDFANSIITEDTNIYAKWNINQYTVAFREHDGTEIKVETVNHGNEATAPANPSRVGYTFDGWDVDYSNVTSDLTITAQYSVNQYTVSFESNGGGIVNSQNIDYNTLVAQPTEPTKEGYNFGGWYKESGLTNAWDFTAYTVPAENITLYAKWLTPKESITMIASPNTIEFTENLNQIFTLDITYDTVVGSVYKSDLSLGGVFSSLSIEEINNSETTVEVAVYGDLSSAGIGKITLNSNKLKNKTSSLTAEVTVVAEPTYTVSYNGNGAISGTVPIDSIDYEEGDTVQVRGNTGNLTKLDYEFIGWNTTADGTGTSYIAEDTFGMGSSNITLYAKWNIKVYTVTFKDHDGTILITQAVERGTRAIEPASPITEVYRFIGWYEDAALTQAYDFSTAIIEDITLYAKWTRINTDNENEDDDEPEEDQENNENQQLRTIIIVNGQEKRVGEESVIEEGKKVVQVKVDSESVIKILEETKNKQNEQNKENIVEIPIGTQNADKTTIKLTGDIVKRMEEDGFNLSIKSKEISYVISAKEVEIESVAEKLGMSKDKLQEIEVEVQIEKTDEELLQRIQENAQANDYEIIFPPVSFKVIGKTTTTKEEEKEIEVSRFNQYVQRVMKIPEGIDPSKITTGVLYNEDGTFSHIPTTVYMENGAWYAKLNSLTNSCYSVIWNPIKVASVENHWSREAVKDMAERLIIKNPENFSPNGFITRGEFAEYITKALGLYRTGVSKADKFTDVKTTDQLADAIYIATEYGIINGYPDRTFKPDKEINREEAMIMYANAMDIAGLKELNNNKISSYSDKEEISSWAYASVKKVLSTGVFNGKTKDTIVTKATFTYAEAATAIRNLLTKADLINH